MTAVLVAVLVAMGALCAYLWRSLGLARQSAARERRVVEVAKTIDEQRAAAIDRIAIELEAARTEHAAAQAKLLEASATKAGLATEINRRIGAGTL